MLGGTAAVEWHKKFSGFDNSNQTPLQFGHFNVSSFATSKYKRLRTCYKDNFEFIGTALEFGAYETHQVGKNKYN